MAQTQERSDYVAKIDQIMRDIVWHSQKQAAHTLTRPDIDLTLPQLITLFAIHQGKTCRMSTLAEVTQQSAGTLTGIVNRLIDDGLVERARNASDRRVVQVELTAEGKRRLEHATSARYQDSERVLDHFPDDDLAQLHQLLRRFLDGIQSEAPPNE